MGRPWRIVIPVCMTHFLSLQGKNGYCMFTKN